MKIRPTQWEALGSVASDVLAQRIMAILHDEAPETRAERDQDLLEEIKRQIQQARGYGLTSEREIGIYVITAYLLGRDFDTRFPEAAAVLQGEMAARDKADWLQNWTETLFSVLEETR